MLAEPWEEHQEDPPLATIETRAGPILEGGPQSLRSDHATRFLLEHLRVPRGAAAAEPGCGDGVLSIFMARAGAARVVGTDVDRAAIEAARRNAALNRVARVEFIEGSLLDPVPGPLDLVVANLPHRPAPRPFNPRYYGGPEGCDLVLALVEQAARKLVSGGLLCLYLNSIANVRRVLRALSPTFDVSIRAEKKRFFTREEFEALLPGLFDHLVALRGRGIAEFSDGDGETQPHFMARIYEARLR